MGVGEKSFMHNNYDLKCKMQSINFIQFHHWIKFPKLVLDP